MKRVFILGAGFSRPAGMPLATSLLPLIMQKIDHSEMEEWLDSLCKQLHWLSGNSEEREGFALNIEQVFHFANFHIEAYRLRQQLAPVGRHDGPATPWSTAESITSWLSYLENDLRDVILEEDDKADLTPITRWAASTGSQDTVITFNYDTLVERAISSLGRTWNHGMNREGDEGVAVCKFHGSIDWIVAHRSQRLAMCDLLFEKPNRNRTGENTGHVEDDYQLWRCRTREQLQKWISGRDLQLLPEGALPMSVGIAGLGSYKQLHRIPGLGTVWTHGLRKLNEADRAIVVGFSMSDFDVMAQLQFAEVARQRETQKRPLQVTVIDPVLKDETKNRFSRVFRSVEFDTRHHEKIDWCNYS